MDKKEKEQKSPWGSTLENFLEEEGMLDEANAYADKEIQAYKDRQSMKEQKSCS